MVINKDGLITENQNTRVQNKTANEELKENNVVQDNFGFSSNNNQIITNLINRDLTLKNDMLENSKASNLKDGSLDNGDSYEAVEISESLSEISKSSSEAETVETISEEHASTTEKETVETNCLALTVRKDYNYAIAKNTVFKTIRMSTKVAIPTFLLNLIKPFF